MAGAPRLNSKVSLKLAFILLALKAASTLYAVGISINNCTSPLTTDLNFGENVQSDSALTIPPGSSDNINNACFLIAGNTNAQYTVTLPSSVTVTKSGASSVVVNNFQSATSTGTLNLGSSGQQYLYIGATRAALPAGQTTGTYSKSFTVSVRYTSGGTTKSDTVLIKFNVIKILAVSKVSDLNFGTSAPTDPVLTIPPGSSENPSNASFSVTGEPNHTYQLLTINNIDMTTGGGGVNRTISVSNFISNPAFGTNTLPGSGTMTVYVGATRNALSTGQVPGAYTGVFSFTVIY